MAGKRVYELDERLSFLVNRVAAALMAAAEAVLRPHGLTLPLWRVLAALAARGEMRQVDLAEVTSIDPSTISRVVGGAVRRGLVSRVRSATSSREVTVSLTGPGRDLFDRLVVAMEGYEAMAAAGLDEDDFAALRRSLRRMHGNIAADRAAPRPLPED